MQITPQPAADRENLAGLVERVTFHNEDSGFCVLRVKARGQRDLITVVGHAAVRSRRRRPCCARAPQVRSATSPPAAGRERRRWRRERMAILDTATKRRHQYQVRNV